MAKCHKVKQYFKIGCGFSLNTNDPVQEKHIPTSFFAIKLKRKCPDCQKYLRVTFKQKNSIGKLLNLYRKVWPESFSKFGRSYVHKNYPFTLSLLKEVW